PIFRGGRSVITVRDLRKTFVTPVAEIQALRGVDLDVRSGDIFGIVGFSGSGKSTLLRCINRLERPDSGLVRLDGQDVTALDRKALAAVRQKVGMIFQHFHLLDSRTVHDNIAYPLEIAGVDRDRIERRVSELIELVGISDKLLAYPGQLSGGQKQRVAIARALANDPSVLLSDEATSALDPETTLSILELLKSINGKTGLTIVLVTHELDVVRVLCNRVAVLETGHVVEQGDVDKVFADPRSPAARRFVEISRGFRDGDLFIDGEGI
ncbi:MAG TPA: ATP-binding cassette domain-containing protein, partial [Holophaga sp.]|nr:ATP-binding cassette domain-containing protein [Holophaga sp.]